MTLVLAGLAVAAGAAAQVVTGMGFSLVCAPLLIALEGPLDGVRLNLGLSVLINLVLLLPQRHHVRRRDTVRLFVPAALATPVAAWGARRADPDVLLVAAGVLTVGSAAALLAGMRLRRSSTTLAGAVSGAMNTVAGIGGPVVAIHAINDAWPTRERKATFQLYFLLINLVALVALGPKLPPPLLVGGLGAGWALGHWLDRRVPDPAARTATLLVAAAGGFVALTRGFL